MKIQDVKLQDPVLIIVRIKLLFWDFLFKSALISVIGFSEIELQ